MNLFIIGCYKGKKIFSSLSILCLRDIAWITRKGGELIGFILWFVVFRLDFIGSVKSKVSQSVCVRALITGSCRRSNWLVAQFYCLFIVTGELCLRLI